MRTNGLVATTLASITLAAMSPATGARAADDRWCATSARGTENCGYSSFEQCSAAASGITRLCRPNPFPGTNYGSSAGSWGATEPVRRHRSN
jgi:hypothetical protein